MMHAGFRDLIPRVRGAPLVALAGGNEQGAVVLIPNWCSQVASLKVHVPNSHVPIGFPKRPKTIVPRCSQLPLRGSPGPQQLVPMAGLG